MKINESVALEWTDTIGPVDKRGATNVLPDIARYGIKPFRLPTLAEIREAVQSGALTLGQASYWVVDSGHLVGVKGPNAVLAGANGFHYLYVRMVRQTENGQKVEVQNKEEQVG